MLAFRRISVGDSTMDDEVFLNATTPVQESNLELGAVEPRASSGSVVTSDHSLNEPFSSTASMRLLGAPGVNSRRSRLSVSSYAALQASASTFERATRNTRSRSMQMHATQRRTLALSMGRARTPSEVSLVRQLAQIKDHPPYVTWFFSIVQVVVFIVAVSLHGFAPWGFGVREGSRNATTFANTTAIILFTEPENMWFGPRTEVMLHYGAKFTPCSRQEPDFAARSQNTTDTETDTFGCCVDVTTNTCGMMNNGDCLAYRGQWTQVRQSCSTTISSGLCSSIVLRPCCYFTKAECFVTTRDVCDALPGPRKFHENAETCSEVNCMETLCGMFWLGSSNGKPNQFWRFVTPIFMHVGVGHIVMNLVTQIFIGGDIESVLGHAKFALLYLLSGIAGNILASLLDPVTFSVGASSSIYGLVGARTVDALQSWHFIHNKARLVCELLVQTVLILGIGTLPWLDNFAHIGGFLVGFVFGLGFLPFLHFNKRDKFIKALVSREAQVLLLLIVVAFTIMFYLLKDPHFCSFCKYLNCVPWTKNMCASSQ